ncbi:hypothetical protein NLM24_47750 [Nocardia zapadnayensis]|uniref:hypothetical protein n=1 Tax=Brevibacterium sp. R8603A2 TaxID=2929779 RepID=UPI001FF70B34|nr:MULTISPECIES: hypothetical protein [Actinomycetes]MCK1804215.1 hypothetical protein [Brevibacterium sp. R8603A2]MCX0278104.1 hypothetical protein [Nocardia zapadnayensis]
MSAKDDQAAAIDLTRAPRGELAAAQLVTAVADTGDLAERHYLELKGPPDLATKVNKAKVAKFILGAANRLPDRAADAFDGYGVMIVGITKQGIEGVPPIEMLALSQVIQPFLGAAGPHWDVVRVPVEGSTNQVLVILVDPPQVGQLPFICRSNGEGLQSGRIYYRGDGETREANADELDLLMARGASRPPAPVELDVAVVGTVVPLIVDEQTVDDLVTNARQRLLAALPKPEPKQSPATGFAMGSSDSFRAAMGASSALSRLLTDQTSAASQLAAFTATEEPEKRSEDEYRAEIDAWEERFRAAWPDAVELFAVHTLPANEVTVVNKTQTFLHDVEVKLHLDGAVEAEERQGYGDGPDWRDLKLPLPPRKWGPTKRDLGLHAGYSAGLAASIASQPYMSRPYLPPDASWKTTGSVDVEVVVGNLRPEATFQTDDGDAVLLIRGETPEQIQGTWTATARGYNQVFTGAVQVTIAEPTRLTNLIRDFFNLD